MTSLFSRSKPVVGVIHVGALPGTPQSSQTVAELVASAREEAKIYRECGVDGVIIENMHDVPYLRGEVGPEIVAAMTAIGSEVKSECQLPVGVQILAGAVEFMGASCVIVTGSVTGQAPTIADVQEAKSHCHLPVFLGSGISERNIEQVYNEADGFIIGSAFKVDGLWSNTIDPAYVTRFIEKLSSLLAARLQVK